eukprot:1192840-Prorocentrum_minimum.AAC.5
MSSKLTCKLLLALGFTVGVRGRGNAKEDELALAQLGCDANAPSTRPSSPDPETTGMCILQGAHQPALREAIFLAAHHVNSTRIHQQLGCDFKVAKRCEKSCMFVHGKIIGLEPIVAGRAQITSWAGRIGLARSLCWEQTNEDELLSRLLALESAMISQDAVSCLEDSLVGCLGAGGVSDRVRFSSSRVVYQLPTKDIERFLFTAREEVKENGGNTNEAAISRPN